MINRTVFVDNRMKVVIFNDRTDAPIEQFFVHPNMFVRPVMDDMYTFDIIDTKGVKLTTVGKVKDSKIKHCVIHTEGSEFERSQCNLTQEFHVYLELYKNKERVV